MKLQGFRLPKVFACSTSLDGGTKMAIHYRRMKILELGMRYN